MMRKKSLVAMICVLLLAMAAAPVLAVPHAAPNADTAVRPQVGLFSMVWDWLTGLVPAPEGPGLDSVWAAGSGDGTGGATDGAATTSCELCPVAEGNYYIDPDG